MLLFFFHGNMSVYSIYILFVESCVLHSQFICKLDWLMAPVSLLTSCLLSSRKAKSHRQNYVYVHPFLLSVAIHWLEGCDPGSITKTNPAKGWLIDQRNQRLMGGITFKTAASPWFNLQDPCQTFTAWKAIEGKEAVCCFPYISRDNGPCWLVIYFYHWKCRGKECIQRNRKRRIQYMYF